MGRTRMLLAAALVASMLVLPGASGASQFTYATMSDGVKIALAVSFPAGFDSTKTYPALFVMDGYDGGAGPYPTDRFGREKYVVVHASIRGTGCSGGKFNLFDRRSSFDGREIIDTWIPSQSWSNGRVGVIGHSYPGLTGFLVASTSPRNLYATAVSGLIDDLYRGIVYPGGVPNYGFPALWTLAYRPASETAGNASRYAGESARGDPTCAANVASRPPRDVLDDPVLNGINTQDSQWWASHALRTYISAIDKPIHITQQYQDEQTGPRGGHVLFENIPAGLPKRLQLTNGIHSTTGIAQADRNDWLDCWIIQKPAGLPCATDAAGHAVDDPSTRVQVHFETTSGGANPPLASSDWPLPETQWTRYYLRANGTLQTDSGDASEPSTSYVSLTAGRQTLATAGFGIGGGQVGNATYVSGPDEATYRLDFAGPTAIAGPINLTLTATSTAPDTDFFIDLLDLDTASGQYQYLQRGMQRSSHRSIDWTHSDYVKAPNPAAGTLYRALHPHTNPQPILPSGTYTYEIEVFPVGHVFRAGHALVMKVHAPAPADPISIYAWVSAQPTAVNTIIQADGASSLLLPLLPVLPPLGAAPACGAQIGVPCFKPIA